MKVHFNAYKLITVSILLFITLVILIPMMMVFSTSIAPEREVLKYGMRVIPTTGISLDSYEYILGASRGFVRAYGVTIFETVIGTFISVLITSLTAYPMSKMDMPGRKPLFFFFFFTMLFSGGLIPTFMVVKSVGLYNSIWSMIIPGAMSVWYMILLCNFFSSLPASIEESATIDGANDIVILFQIALPLSLPAMATISLFYAVGYWNQWFPPVIYINDSAKWPLQVLLRDMIHSVDFGAMFGVVYDPISPPPPNMTVKCSAIVVAMLPIMMVYPFLQKYFAKGVMVGAVKG